MSEELTVTPKMIEAGLNAFYKTEALSVRRLLEVAYPVMRAMELGARPTPDLGELVEAVRRAIGGLSALEETRVLESLHAELERGEKDK